MEKPLRNKKLTIAVYVLNLIFLSHLAIIQVSVYNSYDGLSLIQIPIVLLLASIFGTYAHGLYKVVRFDKKPHVYAASIGSALTVYSIILFLLVFPNFAFDYLYVYFSILLVIVSILNVYQLIDRERYSYKSKIRIPLAFVITVALFVYTYYTIHAVQIGLA